jgi:hypothetical protein
MRLEIELRCILFPLIKGLGQGGDQKPDDHSDRAPEFLCGDRINFQKDKHLCSIPPIRPLWWSGQTEATPQ